MMCFRASMLYIFWTATVLLGNNKNYQSTCVLMHPPPQVTFAVMFCHHFSMVGNAAQQVIFGKMQGGPSCFCFILFFVCNMPFAIHAGYIW